MNIFERLTEARILDAIRNGELDNLSGSGKPIEWKEQTLPHDRQLAYELLQKNGFSLPWIEEGKEIRSELGVFRRLISDVQARNVLSSTSYTRQTLENRLHKLNKKIMHYNMSAPLDRFHIPVLDFQRELERARSEPPELSGE